MNPALIQTVLDGLADGRIVPYLGAGALADVKDAATGAPIPAGSESLILAMNGGRPMAPKLMYEFPRAAMNVELKRGRGEVNRFLTRTYRDTPWTRGAVHDWIAQIRPRYVIDINRDTQLQDSYAGVPHNLVVGVARIGGTPFRYRLYRWDGGAYTATEDLDMGLPVLFKPMGTPRPRPDYIASDADYVDYITELMGGFAIPPQLKRYREDRQYLLIGLRLNRDTERMVLSDLIHDAGRPAGWALIDEPTDKERRFCGKHGLEIVGTELAGLVADTATA